MEELLSRYINPFTDYGFKYLFGTEPNKEFTLAFVNELLHGQESRMKSDGMPSELIAKYTGLSAEEIDSL